jgi:methionyl-tRNA formyltransferase
MQMEAGLDTGPMWRVASTPIDTTDTAASLHDRLATMGARLLVDFLPALAAGGLQATPQPEQGVTYAAKIEKREAAIDWALPAVEIERRVRAFDPFPGSTFALGAEVVKLWRARACEGRGRPGEVLVADGQRLVVACGEQALELLELQRSGGKRLPAVEFLRGLPVPAGTVLAPPVA